MRKEGQITVFLSLIIICICTLMAALLQSAKVAGARCYLQVAANSSLDSVMSQYHRKLWETYHLLAFEYEDEKAVAGEMEKYVDSYLQGGNLYSLSLPQVEVTRILPMTAENGRLLEKQVLDYMKYGIWNQETDTQVLTEMIGGLKEAADLRTVAKLYEERALDTFLLEEALEAIHEKNQKIKKEYDNARGELEDYHGPGFRRAAQKLKGHLEDIPKLVEEYERQAEALASQLETSRKDFEEKSASLSPQAKLAMERELSEFDSYLATDGARRKEVISLISLGEENVNLVEWAVEEALEIEDIIESWESSDDEEDEENGKDEELSEADLWEPVISRFNKFKSMSLSFSPGEKDKKTRDLLEQVKNLAFGNLLPLVLEEDVAVSETGVLLDQAPSKAALQAGDESFFDYSLEDLLLAASTNEYGIYHFDHFLKEPASELSYQLEYIINGRDSDKENLEEMVAKLLALREGMNFLHIITDNQKRQEAKTLALSIVGGTGMLPLVSVMAFFIMGVWAFGEALVDVRTLLKGGSVPFAKTADSWNLSLSQLLEIGSNKSSEISSHKGEGLDYQGYIRMFLYLKDRNTRNYRYMDVIQDVIRRKQSDFLMETCGGSVEVTTRASGRIAVKSQKTY